MTSSDRKFWVIIIGFVGLGAIVCFFALRHDERLSRMELLERAPSAPPLEELKEGLREVASGRTVYVPVYSHIYTQGGAEQLLEVTLSIRNADLENAIVVESIRYYDTEGAQLKEYLRAPIRLRPLASTDFLVEHRDESGGAGANFLVDWAAEDVVTEPIIETVMVASEGNRSFAFVRPGFPVTTYGRDPEVPAAQGRAPAEASHFP